MNDILDGSGIEPHKCSFRIEKKPGQAEAGFTLESRQSLYKLYVTPTYPRKPIEFRLGEFRCVGCVFENGIKTWGPLGCPVHTPSQSWPIRNALESVFTLPVR